MNPAIIIQARLGSTRLPKKVLMKFYNDNTILDIIVQSIKKATSLPIVIATSDNQLDDTLEKYCLEKNYLCFRGSEHNVLKRFIDTAEHYGFSHLFRICADNPFLQPDTIKEILTTFNANLESEYISYNVFGKPSILTHYGFWPEFASIYALQKALQKGTMFNHEHVTNYIYTHPEEFKIVWLKTPVWLHKDNDYRLTVDDITDFKNTQQLFELCFPDLSPANIFHHIEKEEALIISMKNQITKNSK